MQKKKKYRVLDVAVLAENADCQQPPEPAEPVDWARIQGVVNLFGHAIQG